MGALAEVTSPMQGLPGHGAPLVVMPAPSLPSTTPKYPMLPDMARVLAYYLTTSRECYAALGEWINPDALPDTQAALVVAAVKAVAVDYGHGPGGVLPVLQRLRRWLNSGTHTKDQIINAAGMLDGIEGMIVDGTVPSVEDVVMELVPLLKSRARQGVLWDAAKLAAANEDITPALSAAVEVERMGIARIDMGDGEAAMFDVAAMTTNTAPSGVPELDAVLGGGWPCGVVSLIAGGTNSGKSMLIVHSFVSVLLSGEDALLATIENPKAEVKARVLANLTGIPTNSIRSGEGLGMAQSIYKRHRLGGYRIQEFEDGNVTPEDIGKWIRLYQDTTKRSPRAVFIDGIDHMAVSAAKLRWQMSSYDKGEVLMQGLINVGKATGVAIIATSHIKRSDCKPIKAPDNTLIPGRDDLAESQHRAKKAATIIGMASRKDDTTGLWYSYLAVAKARYTACLDVFGPLECDFATARVVLPVVPVMPQPTGELPWGDA